MSIVDRFRRNFLVPGCISGILLVLGYRIPYGWPLLLIALVPLLYVAKHEESFIRRCISGTIAGSLLMGSAVFWLFNTLPLPSSYYSYSPLISFVLVAICWILTSVVTGATVGLWVGIISKLRPQHILDTLMIGALWEGGEYLRMLLYNALSFSTIIHNPPFFSAGFLGYPLMDSESLRQLAALGGIYTCGFFVVMANVFIFSRLCHGEKIRAQVRPFMLFVIALCVVVVAPVASMRMFFSNQKTTTVYVAIDSVWVSPKLDEVAAAVPIAQQEYSFVASSSALSANIILTPEDSKLFYPFTLRSVGEFLRPGSSASVLDSGAVETGPGKYPLRSFNDTAGNQIGIRDKQILTPGGEYLPGILRTPLQLMGGRNAVAKFEKARTYSSGIGQGNAFVANGVRAVPLFCLETMVPGLGASIAQSQSDTLLLVPAAHLLFRPSYFLEQDSLRFARAQAIQAQLPLASSVLQGSAFVIDKYGRLLAHIGTEQRTEFKVVPVQVDATQSAS